MDKLVYFLCGIMSVTCAVFLLRAYKKTSMGLLLWSGVCFSLLALSNLLLYVDLVIYPQIDLLLLRTSLTCVAGMTLLFALIFETV